MSGTFPLSLKLVIAMACSLAIQNIVRSGNEPKELQAKLKETPPSKKEKANIDVISVSFWKQS
jgi:hypothetical protein